MSGSNALAWGKLILTVVIIAALAWIVYKMKNAASDAYTSARETISDTLENLDPTNTNNVIASAVNRQLSAAVGREENLGGWLYSIFHRDPVEEMIERQLEQNPWNYQQTFTP